MKGLKNISIYFNRINRNTSENTSYIKGINNTSANELMLFTGEHYHNYTYLLNNFTNLTSLIIKHQDNYCSWCKNYSQIVSEIKIKEKLDSKINRISIEIQRNIEIYCSSYENLRDINIKIDNKTRMENSYNVLKDCLPIFSKNCRVIFKSLINFEFCFEYQIHFSIIENIYNNIDKMPKLRSFSFICLSKENNEDFYNKLIKKLILKKLEKITLKIQKHKFKELKEIYGNINEYNLNNFNIGKMIINKK